MKSLSLIPTLFAISLSISSCGHGPEETSNSRPLKSTIELSEVSPQGCLNIEKYSAAIFRLSPEPAIQVATTDVAMTSTENISSGFRIRQSYENFVFTQGFQGLFTELPLWEQADCTTVVAKTWGGDREEYKITESQPNRITFENQSGDSYSLQWQSLRHFNMSHKFKTGDYLCNSDSKAVVRIETDYSWEPETVSAIYLPGEYISPDYLREVTLASGYPLDSLYFTDSTTGSAVETMLVSDELKKLKEQPMNESYRGCGLQ